MNNQLGLNFEEQYTTLEKLCNDNRLEFSLSKEAYPITMTIRPYWEDAAQEKLAFEDMPDKSNAIMEPTDPEAFIKFIFADELHITTSHNFSIDEALFNKIKNNAKKLHYAYLQLFFAIKHEVESFNRTA